MSARPFIIFPEPRPSNRHKPPGRGPKYHFPDSTRQFERIGPKLQVLENAFNAQDSQRVALRNDPGTAEVEKVLVIETVGAVDEFFRALKDLDGLEWLADFDEDGIEPDEDFFVSEEEREKGLTGRLYLIMSNQRGVQQLLSLWRTYQANPQHPQFQYGKMRWKYLFTQLKDIRLWGAEDRLRETGILEDWQDRVTQQDHIPMEIELWCRRTPEERQRAENRVRELVRTLQGTAGASCHVQEIAYHAVPAKLPRVAVQSILSHRDVSLINAEDVMFFRPVSQAVIKNPTDEPSGEPTLSAQSRPQGEAIAALLDGLPLQNHQRLAERLIIDDPDGWTADYTAAERLHGTAMASLIINGELDAAEPPISRPLYVRPVLKPIRRNPHNVYEGVPEEVLPVDLIYRAVKRLFEEEGTERPAAPNIKIINLSIGILGRTYLRFPSPLARLLDYLSFKYRVLFLVSAGNHSGEIELERPRNDGESLSANPQDLQKEVLKAIVNRTRLRRILSPSEAINALTIGAIHHDHSTYAPTANRVNPFFSIGMPSPISAHGFGFRRAIKPEICHNGGRMLYMLKPGTVHEKVVLQEVSASSAPGQKVACPGRRAGDIAAVRCTRGTSNATALITREAIKAYDALEELKRENDRLGRADQALLLRTLLVHSAAWRDSCAAISEALGIDSRDELIARLVGYGKIDAERILGCTDQRATLIGFGELQEEKAHVYSIPLPPSLIGQRIKRRVTVTLSWFSPVFPAHTDYRQAFLWFAPFGDNKEDGNLGEQLKVDRTECDFRTVKRGTIQHEVFEGESAVTYTSEDALQIQVNCRSVIGRLATLSIPYVLAVSLEVAPSLTLPIYEEIQAKLQTVVEVATRPA